MTNYLLAGGGTAGHVNPLLAIADAIKHDDPNSSVLALGTASGLETTLVPQRGYELATIEKVPFPRRPNFYALKFPAKFAKAISDSRKLIRERKIDVVVGFGGYASAPAYLAAAIEKVPVVIHEANALPGMANKLGAGVAKCIAVAFENTPLKNSVFTGMPLRKEVELVAAYADKKSAREHFGLDPATFTLLVTGGSLGAKAINDTIEASRDLLSAAGIQVLHIVGGKSELAPLKEKGYLRISYCDRMDLAIAASDFAVSRAGASTVSEFSAVGLPALYLPYSVGNGEQRRNIDSVLTVGGAVTVNDKAFNRDFVASELVPLLSSAGLIRTMAAASKGAGVVNGTAQLLNLIKGVLPR